MSETEEGRVKSIGEQIAAVKDEVLAEVRDMLAPLKEGGKAQAAAQQHEEQHLGRASDAAGGIESMVNAAIDKALSGQQQAAAEDAHRKQHEALEAAGAEKPPVERTRRHKLMGWGEPG